MTGGRFWGETLMWDAPWHWVVLAIIVIALFGYKRLPDASRSLGRSLRIFKTEMKGLSQDDAARKAEDEPKAVTAPPAETLPNPAAAPPAPEQVAAPVAAAPQVPVAAPPAAPVAPPAPAEPAPVSDPTAPPQA
jgi:sec-independent protein translocase protein TatA